MGSTPVYLDNAATTRVNSQVLSSMQEAYLEFFANPSSIHQGGVLAAREIERARSVIARKINAESEEIIFTSGGTEAVNLAIKGIFSQKEFQGKTLLTSRTEHACVLETMKNLSKSNFLNESFLKVNNKGLICLEELKEKISKNVLMLSLIHANNETGVLQNLHEIGKICKEYGVLFHVDACQSFCKEIIDVEKSYIDLLSMSAHKIHGPKGIGALFVRKNITLNPLLNGGGQENSLRSGSLNLPGILGFSQAVGFYSEEIIEKVKRLEVYFKENLVVKVPNIIMNISDNKVANIFSLRFEGVSGRDLFNLLNRKGIQVSLGSACSSNKLAPSATLLAMGLSEKESLETIRVSISYDNTKDDLDKLIDILREVSDEFK